MVPAMTAAPANAPTSNTYCMATGAPIFRIEQIGRAHVWTPVTNEQLVCRLLPAKKKKKKNKNNLNKEKSVEVFRVKQTIHKKEFNKEIEKKHNKYISNHE